VRRRQPDVDDDHVRRVGPHPDEQLVGGAALHDDVHAGAGQQPDQAVAQQQAVLGDRYPHDGPPPPAPARTVPRTPDTRKPACNAPASHLSAGARPLRR
jgi:hypothetical protein